MKEAFEEKYQDVLQNIEFAIVAIYRQHPEMTDYSVKEALDALVRAYEAEARGRSAPARNLPPLDQDLLEAVRSMCEWRMGRADLSKSQAKKVMMDKSSAKTLDEIITCLKRIRKSVDRWNKVGGRRGYLDFVRQYIP